MKTDAIDPDDDGTDGLATDPTTMFDVLSDERRQHTLRYLAQKPVAVPLGDVAEYIAVREGAPTRDRYERVLTGLYHLHLPILVRAGAVTYDDEHQTVRLCVDGDGLRPYLELLSRAD